jgi:transcriptional regulator with XRE-family HTH domain
MGIFAERLRRFIKQTGQSDAEVARRLGLQPQRLSNYLNEKSQPDIDTIIRICTSLNVSPNFLFGFTDPDADPSERGVMIASVCGHLQSLDDAKLKLVRDLVGKISAFEYPDRSAERPGDPT